MAGFVKNTTYYRDEVYEWNLPTGWSCPFADQCLVKVNPKTGKFQDKSNAYRCYAAAPERFTGVRKHRWGNFKHMYEGNRPEIPSDAKAVRIHAAGDFFNQAYFDLWLEVCRDHPEVEFWAYTKSVPYWVKRLDRIPSNLTLTASWGGRSDAQIKQYNLKHVVVVNHELVADRLGLQIDTNDDLARIPELNFALLDNQSPYY